MKMIKAIDNIEGLCFKCLCKKTIHKYDLYDRGYGSDFDNFNTYIQLCDDCKPNDIELWFYEQPKYVDYYENYRYEENIHKFIKTLPLQGRELFENRCANGACSYPMDSQDWIDMELDILPDEKYKEYGMYSPSEIKAYEEKFPTCEYPANRVYDDGSIGCWCPFGAFGDKDGNAGLNISDECYSCTYYRKRETPIKSIFDKYWYEYELFMRYNIMKNELENKFGTNVDDANNI